MLKKWIILSLFVMLLMYPVYCFAYTGGTYSYFIDMQTSELGAITVYIPINYAECFIIENNRIINQTQSTITGYISGISATVRFQPFTSSPQYQNGYNWIDLTITNISDYNIPVLKKVDFVSSFFNKIKPYAYLLLFMVVICLLFIK